MKKILLFIAFLFFAGCISAHPGKVVTTFPAPGAFCTGLTFDGAVLWVADYKTDLLYAVKPGNGEVVRSIAAPGFWPAGLAWDGEYLWNIDSKQKKLFKINPQTGTILTVLPAPCSNPEGLVWFDETLWISDSRAKEIYKIDIQDGTAVHTIPAPAKSAHGLAFDGQNLWCADRNMDEIYMVEPENGEVIIVSDAPGPYPRGLTWDGEFLWLVDYENDKLYKLLRQDDDHYRLENKRHARVTLTHQIKGYGSGEINKADVFFALPQDLPQQKIIKLDLKPNADTVTDIWKQEFARFTFSDIAAATPIESKMIVETEISEIHYYIFPDQVGTLDDIPAEIVDLYTRDGSKYQINNEYIQKTAESLIGDETNPYWMARKIFDHVRETLEYKLEGGWNTAPVVLKRGTGSCSEYSFSFIALCHAAGLPARYVGAVVVRGDDASLDDVFHRWPEIYLPNYGWIPIDPQGGDKELPRDRAMNIGHLSNRFLITTQGAGDSRYLGWTYNTNETFISDPRMQVNIETFAEWEPLD